MYLDSDNTCKSCNVNCLTCDGGSSSDCLSCSAPKILYLG